VRRKAATPVVVANRTYSSYLTDGMPSIYTSTVTADPARKFFYDGGNRLTCATTNTGTASCPGVGATLVESYGYSTSSNRTSSASASGTATYAYAGNAITGETRGSRLIDYDYDGPSAQGGRRIFDDENTSTFDNRNYFYDGQGRLRSITLKQPASTVGTYHDHQITILYDHRSRPMTVYDLNVTTGVTRSEVLLWSATDELITRFTTPNTTVPAQFVAELFTQIEPIATGVLRLDYTAGFTERRFYDVHAPLGLPIARYEFTTAGTTSSTWTGDFFPFGELKAETGTTSLRPPWRFEGQLELAGSDARYWNGTTNTKLRETLALNQWRVYDPRLGQYTTPEPYAYRGHEVYSSVYGYALLSPTRYYDPTGLQVDSMTAACRQNPVYCEMVIGEASAGGGGPGSAIGSGLTGLLVCVGLGAVGAGIWWATRVDDDDDGFDRIVRQLLQHFMRSRR
jgi:RHS repeat-associated protein